jgi:hypothetical protein
MQTAVPANRPHNAQVLVDQITRDALRNAALAPTYMAALDITGAALIAVAMVVRSGVSHD